MLLQLRVWSPVLCRVSFIRGLRFYKVGFWVVPFSTVYHQPPAQLVEQMDWVISLQLFTDVTRVPSVVQQTHSWELWRLNFLKSNPVFPLTCMRIFRDALSSVLIDFQLAVVPAILTQFHCSFPHPPKQLMICEQILEQIIVASRCCNPVDSPGVYVCVCWGVVQQWALWEGKDLGSGAFYAPTEKCIFEQSLSASCSYHLLICKWWPPLVLSAFTILQTIEWEKETFCE